MSKEQLNKEIDVAIEKGEIFFITSLLKDGDYLHVRDKDENSLLHKAAQLGLQEITKMLIKEGANVNVVNLEYLTPLHYAVLSGNSEVARLLIESDARVDSKALMDLTPLHLAAVRGNREITKLLLESGAEVNFMSKSNNNTPLHFVAMGGQSDIAKVFIEYGFKNFDYRNHTEVLKLLLEHGAKIDVLNENNVTPLHYAVHFDQTEITKLLLQNGANVKVKTSKGKTALDIAQEKGNKDIVTILQQAALSSDKITVTIKPEESLDQLNNSSRSPSLPPTVLPQQPQHNPITNLSSLEMEKQCSEFERLKLDLEMKMKQELKLKEMELKLKFEQEYRLKEEELKARFEAEIRLKELELKYVKDEKDKKQPSNPPITPSSDQADDIKISSGIGSIKASVVVMPRGQTFVDRVGGQQPSNNTNFVKIDDQVLNNRASSNSINK